MAATPRKRTVSSAQAAENLAWVKRHFGHVWPATQTLLLSFGGQACGIQEVLYDEAMFLRRATVFRPPVRRVPGTPNRCHDNVHVLTASTAGLRGCTGFALALNQSGVDLWLAHSWALDPDGQVTETTVPFSVYCGMVLEPHERDLYLDTSWDPLDSSAPSAKKSWKRPAAKP